MALQNTLYISLTFKFVCGRTFCKESSVTRRKSALRLQLGCRSHGQQSINSSYLLDFLPKFTLIRLALFCSVVPSHVFCRDETRRVVKPVSRRRGHCQASSYFPYSCRTHSTFSWHNRCRMVPLVTPNARSICTVATRIAITSSTYVGGTDGAGANVSN